jgi:hypothetical protein
VGGIHAWNKSARAPLVFILCSKYSHTHSLGSISRSEHSIAQHTNYMYLLAYTNTLIIQLHVMHKKLNSMRGCCKSALTIEPDHCSRRQLWNRHEIAAHPALFFEFFASRINTHIHKVQFNAPHSGSSTIAHLYSALVYTHSTLWAMRSL